MENCPFTNKPCPHPKDIQITTKQGGEMQQLSLCQLCGAQQLAHAQIKSELKSLVGMLFNLLDGEPPKEQIKCTGCGATAESIIKSSRFGCPACYITHRKLATTIFSRCQDGIKHIGKRPETLGEFTTDDITAKIANLENKIRKAVEVENYEVAAVLKKKIEEIKKGGKPD